MSAPPVPQAASREPADWHDDAWEQRAPGLRTGTIADDDLPLTAWLFAGGLFLTAVVSSPTQSVLPDTIKSVIACMFALAALFALFKESAAAGRPLRWSHALWVPFGLAVFSAAGALWAPPAQALTEAVRWAVMGVWMVLALHLASLQRFELLARTLHLAAVAMALLALAQFWFDIAAFPSIPPGATFGNRNMFAEFVVACLPFSLWWLARQPTLSRACVCAIGLGAILVALMSTGTRAALIAAALLLPVALIGMAVAARRPGALGLPGRRLALALLIPVAMIATLGMVPTDNADLAKENAYESRGWTPIERTAIRLGSLVADGTYEAGSSFGIRRAAWTTGKRMIEAHPLLGVGPGAWNTLSPLYSPDNLDTERVWMAHNEALQLLAEYGLAGWIALAGFVALMLAAAGAVLAAWRAGRSAQAIALTTAGLSVGMFTIVSLSGLALRTPTTSVILAVAIGTVVALVPAARRRGMRIIATPAIGRAGMVGSGLALLLAGILSVQGLRAESALQAADLTLAKLAITPGLDKGVAAKKRAEALAQIHEGFAIYENQGLITMSLADALGNQGETDGMLWLTNIMAKTRPHVVALQCNRIKALADQGRMADAEALLTTERRLHPDVPCVEISDFVVRYRSERFAETLALGERLIGQLNKNSDPVVARYLVDTSYRAALRVPALERATQLLEVRAERWPELRASSWLLIGQIRAGAATDRTVPAAEDAFRTALAAATEAERPAMLSRIPERYRGALGKS